MLTKREILIIAAIFLIGAFGLLYFFNVREGRDAYTSTGLKIPTEVHVYVGVVEEVTPRYIMLRALSENNYVPSDALLRIDIMTDTKITRYSLPKLLLYDSKVVETKETPITLDEVRVGDKVEVYTDANSRGLTQFPADIVRAIDYY